MTFDTVVQGGTVVTAADVVRADIGIRDGRIVAIADRLTGGDTTIDAGGRLVLPGGVDAHCHLDQIEPTGAVMADGFRTGSISAAFGGTTTVVCFCMQPKGASLTAAVDDYHRKADGEAVIDYGFHLIVTDPTRAVLGQELPALIRRGHTSLKLYMTYEGLRLTDHQLLEVFEVARAERAIVLVHAENHDLLVWLIEKLEAKGRTEPYAHALSRPLPQEAEATHRAVTLVEIAGVPMVVVHISGGGPLDEVRRGRLRGVTVFAETCPHYLMLTAHELSRPGMLGAKCVCSPPLRDEDAQANLWRGIEDGTVDVVNSDHAPYRFDGQGKLVAGMNAPFRKVPNGMPGIETRMPILFSEGVVKGRIDLSRFVALTASNNAKLYGLHPRKGTIAVGADADLALWDPEKRVTIRNENLHHNVDYTPYEGLEIQGWPQTVMSRGVVVVEDGELKAAPGHGRFLEQGTSSAWRSPDRIKAWL